MGICNNPTAAAFTPLRRETRADPANKSGKPSGQSRPSARRVSNVVHAQNGEDSGTANNLSQLFTITGQLLDHDIGITPGGGGKFKESFNIPVKSKSDPLFNPKKGYLEFNRS